MPTTPFHPKALVRLLALASLAYACTAGAAQGLEGPADEVGMPGAALTFGGDPAPSAPDALAPMPQAGAEPAAALEPEAGVQLAAATSGGAKPDEGADPLVDTGKACLPEPNPRRPGRLLRWLGLLWTALLVLADPQPMVCQPFPLPLGPPPAPLPPVLPLLPAPQAPLLGASPAFPGPAPQGMPPFQPMGPAGATAALNDALARTRRLPLPIASATQLLANLTGARMPTAAPPSPSNASAGTPDTQGVTDQEAATLALVQAGSFVQDKVLEPGSKGGEHNRSSAQIMAQIASVQDQLDAALALRPNSLPTTEDAQAEAIWSALASFSGIASAALASPTALSDAILAAGTASEIDETITNFMNLYLITDLRLPGIELNVERFANFSTSDGKSPEDSGIGPPSIRVDWPGCFNCTPSCNFVQNSYQYATAVLGTEAAAINLSAYIYFFMKGVELAALDTAILAQAAAQAPSKSAAPSTGGPRPARRLLQAMAMEAAHPSEGTGSGPEAAAPPPLRQFPAPLNRYPSRSHPNLPPLDTLPVQDVMAGLGITGTTPYDPGCTACCFLEVNKPLLAAARLSVVTAWLNAIGAGLFGLRVDLAVQAFLETLDPTQRPAALGGLQANATRNFNDFLEGANPPPPGSGDPEAPSDGTVLQTTLAQIARAVGSTGAPPSPERLSGILGTAMENRRASRQGTNTNLTDVGWYGLQAMTRMATRMPSADEVQLVTGSLNLAEQWLGNAGYLLRLLSNAVALEANQIAQARAAKVLVDYAHNRTTGSVYPEAGNQLCASRKCLRECNRLNYQIQDGAVQIRLVSAQLGGVAYILAITANFINLGIDANQIINAILAQPAPAPPANMTANPWYGVPFGMRFYTQSSAKAPAPMTAASFGALLEPMDASLADAMNMTHVIALPQAFLSANTSNGLPVETYGLPGVIGLVKQYVRAANITNNCLPCCNLENSVAILDADVATLLSSQFVLSGYVLTDVAAGIRIGLQAVTDLSLLPTLVQAINATLSRQGF